MMALGNLTFGLLVSIYSRTTNTRNPHLNLWRVASLVTGVGFLIGWMRPLLPTWAQSYAHVGNAMQIVGLCLMLGAMAGFFKVPRWQSGLKHLVVLEVIVYAASVLLSSNQHHRIIVGTLAASVPYLGIVVLLVRDRQHDRWLTRVMASSDALVIALLLTKVGMGMSGVEFTPYAGYSINGWLYSVAFLAMMGNGFGFLLLVKQADDQDLLLAMDKLSVADERQRQFIAMLSHEVRSPLAVIDATTQLMRLKLPPESTDRELLERIRRGTHRLLAFFENALTQDRLDNPGFVVAPHPVNLGHLVTSIKESQEYFATGRVLQMALDTPDIHVLGDDGLLRVMLDNLLSNAIKYSAPDSSVRIHLALQGPLACLAIHNQGLPIPPDELPLLFEKYHRGRAAQGIPGAGLGLTLVKHIVDMHSGQISVKSQAGEGTLVEVCLPVAAVK